jgi:hypothetical protein
VLPRGTPNTHLPLSFVPMRTTKRPRLHFVSVDGRGRVATGSGSARAPDPFPPSQGSFPKSLSTNCPQDPGQSPHWPPPGGCPVRTASLFSAEGAPHRQDPPSLHRLGLRTEKSMQLVPPSGTDGNRCMSDQHSALSPALSPSSLPLLALESHLQVSLTSLSFSHI